MSKAEESKNNKNYSPFAKCLHWGFVALFLYGVIKQVDNLSQLEDRALLVFEMVFAALFFVLLVVRFVYMKKTQISSLPEDTPHWQQLAAQGLHYGMYASLTLIAISGMGIGVLFSQGLKEGLLIQGVVAIHEVSVTSAYLLVAIHIAAAIYHRLLKDGVWRSMVPVWKD
ncbi:cytochrome B [Veronia nyctiphanis]|uniref:Cytochrome B n=1 Tax=Veronia nyctiphanis TaxID=1278244 RepID=A0A4Q0YSM1_9GAMM|nr:cytochrome b/b6 domain-containing protein [Veronia nyctiphanis]RXJ73124.1 cytochrome B [Veronia nyctiphanis]